MDVEDNWKKAYELCDKIEDDVTKDISAMLVETLILSAANFKTAPLEPVGDFDLCFFFSCLLKGVEQFRGGKSFEMSSGVRSWMINATEGDKVITDIADKRALEIAVRLRSILATTTELPMWKFDLEFAFLLLKIGLDRPQSLDLAFQGKFLSED